MSGMPTTEPIPVDHAFAPALARELDMAVGSIDGGHVEERRLRDGLAMILEQLRQGAESVRVSTAKVGHRQSVAAYLFDLLTDSDYIGEYSHEHAKLRTADPMARWHWLEAMAGLVSFVNRLEHAAHLGHDKYGDAIALDLCEPEAAAA